MRSLSLLAGLATAALAARGRDSFDTLVTFGDSWTDNGRLVYYINNGGNAPPPGQSHPELDTTSSGGLSWAQYAAREADVRLVNYAVGGGVTSNSLTPRWFDYINRTFPAVLEDQLPSFEADIKYKSMFPNRRADNTLYALWIGTNDLGANAFLTDSQVPGKTLSDFVESVWAIFDRVYKTGGRRFVLLNTGPLELAPMYATVENGGTQDSQFWLDKTRHNVTAYTHKIKQYSTSVNTIFDYGLPVELQAKNRWPKAKFDLFDVHSLLVDIHSNPNKYLDAPYNATGYFHHCEATNSAICTDMTDLGPLSGFMWYDELHPSPITSKPARSIRYLPCTRLVEADMNATGAIVADHFLEVLAGKSPYGTRYE